MIADAAKKFPVATGTLPGASKKFAGASAKLPITSAALPGASGTIPGATGNGAKASCRVGDACATRDGPPGCVDLVP